MEQHLLKLLAGKERETVIEHTNALGYELISAEDEVQIEKLSKLAGAIVKDHYDPIIGAEQNDYMIEMFQSQDAIKKQLEDGHTFYAITQADAYIGYFAYYPKEGKLYLDKFYLHKDIRGNGYGSRVMHYIKALGIKEGYSAVFLNVNKYNTQSICIYEHMGFVQIRAEKNPIGHGYYMDDYVLECRL